MKRTFLQILSCLIRGHDLEDKVARFYKNEFVIIQTCLKCGRKKIKGEGDVGG